MPRKYVLLPLVMLCVAGKLYTQQIAFQRYYPPMTWANVFTEEDGTFTLIGMSVLSSAAGPSDVMFVKLDSAGNAIYYRKINAGYYDDPACVIRRGSNYLLTGFYGAQYLNNWKPYVLEIDSLGFVVKGGCYGTDSTQYTEGGLNICVNEYGGYTILGYTYNLGAGMADLYLIKTDSSGEAIWGKSYGGGSDDSGFDPQLIHTSDNGYLLASRCMSFNAGFTDILVIKTDSAGNIEWQEMVGDTGFEEPRYAYQMSDSSYFILANSSTFDYWNGDMVSVHLDKSGNMIETKTLGTKASCGFVEQTDDDRFLITGSHNRKAAFMIADSAFNLLRVTQYDSIISLTNAAVCADGGFIIAGNSYNGPYGIFPATHLIRTNPSGNGCEQTDTIPVSEIVSLPMVPVSVTQDSEINTYPVQFGTFQYNWPENIICYCNVKAEFSDSVSGNYAYFINQCSGATAFEWHFGTSAYSYYAAPYIYYNPGTYNVMLIASDGFCVDTVYHSVTVLGPPADPVTHFTLYPTPTTGLITIDYYVDTSAQSKFEIYDVTGRIVYETDLTVGGSPAEIINLEFLANGLYAWRVLVGDESKWEGKIVKTTVQ